jgi:anaerobic ribonucleoside-triphosphate reductase activating protein
MILRLHHTMARSQANGPGVRAVVWVQGCTLGCAGCFNPATHPPHGGHAVPVATLVQWLRDLATAPIAPITGLSVSGGEPLQQAEAVIALCAAAQALELSVILWTGYTWDELERTPWRPRLMQVVDLLIAGRYQAARHLGRDLRGSANKTLHRGAARRIDPATLPDVPLAEAQVSPRGDAVLWTGMRPVWEEPRR